MLSYQFNKDIGLLHLQPRGPLSKDDFEGLAAVVDPYIEQHGELAGIIIESKVFPGWRDLEAALEHARFIHEHHHRIKKIVLVTDSALGDFAEDIASHFVFAEIRHFQAHHDLLAHDWIRN